MVSFSLITTTAVLSFLFFLMLCGLFLRIFNARAFLQSYKGTRVVFTKASRVRKLLHYTSIFVIFLYFVSGGAVTVISGVRTASGDGPSTNDDKVHGDVEGKIVWRAVKLHVVSGFSGNAFM